MRLLLGHRTKLRKALLQMSRDKTATDEVRTQAREALGSRRVFGYLYDEVDGDYKLYTEQNFGGPLTDFFDWLLENQEAIAALIKMIMSLFS